MMKNWPVEGRAAALLQRCLQSGHLMHAYLFIGPEGALQQETAEHFAKGVLCENRQHPPCGICIHCRRVQSGNHPDLVQIKPDGQVIKIEQIRALQRTFSLKPRESPYKIYIIQKADQMTVEAANSLLKYLEEPPSPVLAILLAENRNRILPTILSRCQIISFDHLPVETIKQKLTQSGMSRDLAELLAKVSESIGKAREWAGLTRFAEVVPLVIQLSEDLANHQGSPFLTIYEKIVKPGWILQEIEVFLGCFAWWYRDALFVKLGITEMLAYTTQIERLQSQAAHYQSDELVQLIDIIEMTKKRLQGHVNQQLALENMVLRLQGVGSDVCCSRSPF